MDRRVICLRAGRYSAAAGAVSDTSVGVDWKPRVEGRTAILRLARPGRYGEYRREIAKRRSNPTHPPGSGSSRQEESKPSCAVNWVWSRVGRRRREAR